MSAPAVELVVLDMAGTTIAATDDVPAALRAAFATVDVHLPDGAIADVRGRAKRTAIGALLERFRPDAADAGAADALYAVFTARLHRSIQASARALPGAEATLAWLRAHGIRSALTTGFDRTTTTLLLERIGWADGIADAVVCADDVARGRPAPDLIERAMERTGCTDAARVVAVGDTVSDLAAADAAGAGGIVGVLSGAHDRARLLTGPPAAILDSVAELPAWLEATGRVGA